MRMNFSMMKKMRILMMISKKMTERMMKMRTMRKKKLQKASLKVNHNKTTSPKEIKPPSPSVEIKVNKVENPLEETKEETKVTKAASPTSITIMVETETLTREDNKVANLTSITIMIEVIEVSAAIEAEVETEVEVETMVENLSIKVEITGKIIKEENLSTKETDSHSFIATNQIFSSYYKQFYL